MSIVEQLEHADGALTAPDLAKLLNVHRYTVYRLAKAGQLPHFRVGSIVRFDPKVIAAHIRAHGVGR